MKEFDISTRIQCERVAESAVRVLRMSIEAKEKALDIIHKTQPSLLSHALVLSQLEVPYERIDHVLHILLVLYDYFTNRNRGCLNRITEDDLIASDNNNVAMFSLYGAESESERENFLRSCIDGYPEKAALTFVVNYLREHGLEGQEETDKYCIRSAKNILDCLANAQRNQIGSPSGRTQKSMNNK